MFKYKGKTFIASKIVGVSEVKTISTGTLACDWDYGFTIFTEGKDIDIIGPSETDSCYNHLLSREQRAAKTQTEINKFCKLLKENL